MLIDNTIRCCRTCLDLNKSKINSGNRDWSRIYELFHDGAEEGEVVDHGGGDREVAHHAAD
jgi:hypothetical protein